MARHEADIEIHIEQLILDGIDVPQEHRPGLVAALREELGRLVAEHGLSPGPPTPQGPWPATPLQLSESTSAADVGVQVGRLVYRELAKRQDDV